MKSPSPRASALIDLWVAAQLLAARADQSLGAVHGIALVEFVVLSQLAAAPEGRMRRVDLAEAIGRSPSGVTRLLKPMEKLGLVARHSNERDARVSLVGLTAAGSERLRDAIPTLDALAERFTRPVGDAQLDSLSGGARAMAR